MLYKRHQGQQQGVRDENPGGKHPPTPMKRERQVEAEGLFHPFEAGGEHHLHNQNGKSQKAQGAPEIIRQSIFSLEVEPGSQHQRRHQHREVKVKCAKGGAS